MSALISIIMFGNSIGLYHMFLVAILLVWLCVFFITGDGYDMRGDVLASIAENSNDKHDRKEENIIESKTEKCIGCKDVISGKKQETEHESDREKVEKRAV